MREESISRLRSTSIRGSRAFSTLLDLPESTRVSGPRFTPKDHRDVTTIASIPRSAQSISFYKGPGLWNVLVDISGADFSLSVLLSDRTSDGFGRRCLAVCAARNVRWRDRDDGQGDVRG